MKIHKCQDWCLLLILFTNSTNIYLCSGVIKFIVMWQNFPFVGPDAHQLLLLGWVRFTPTLDNRSLPSVRQLKAQRERCWGHNSVNLSDVLWDNHWGCAKSLNVSGCLRLGLFSFISSFMFTYLKSSLAPFRRKQDGTQWLTTMDRCMGEGKGPSGKRWVGGRV